METIQRWLRHNNATLLLSFLIFLIPLVVFFQLANVVIENESIPFDLAILNWLHGHASPLFDRLLYTATTLGSVLGVVIATGLLFTFFLVKNHRERALLLFASVGGAALANLLLKALFQRERPNIFETFVVETSYSFPSGHAMASSALALCLVLLFWQTKWRWMVTAVAVPFVLAVGISRPYFGVHYPSDIIAGWCASTGWVLLVFYVVNRFKLKKKTDTDNHKS